MGRTHAEAFLYTAGQHICARRPANTLSSLNHPGIPQDQEGDRGVQFDIAGGEGRGRAGQGARVNVLTVTH